MSARPLPLRPIAPAPQPRELPRSIEVEQSLLGCLLLANSELHNTAGLLRAEHFADAAHGAIYGAIVSLVDNGKLADPVTLIDALGDQLHGCGGAPYITGLVASVTSSKNARRYAEIVRDSADLRCLATAAANPAGRTAVQIAKSVIDAAPAAMGHAAPLVALDVHELALMEFKQRDVILSPWLHTQDLCMVFASRGVGKTHFAIGLAYAVATGTGFAKWSAPKARKVLYLDGELPGGVMQQRLLMHCPDVEPEPGFLKIFTPDLVPEGRALPDLSTVAGQDLIDKMIEPDTELVIADNLSSWARSGRENEAESWLPIADWILSLRRRGIAVLLIHHAGKGGQQRGTSKREDLLDVVLGLSHPKDYTPEQGAVFTVEFTKARNLTGDGAEGLEFKLGGTDDKAEWSYRTVEHSTYDRVVALTREGLSAGEICTELDINKSNVSRHLRKAREAGDLPTDPGRKP